VLYCRSGNMSAEAAETLVRLGYDEVWDLRREMIVWEKASFRLEGT
jgi:rhodanese-related sulfurtransferase